MGGKRNTHGKSNLHMRGVGGDRGQSRSLGVWRGCQPIEEPLILGSLTWDKACMTMMYDDGDDNVNTYISQKK